ncbi:GyrI-like domain-containing protein [Zeaxanthinibacter enoshimensis]|uniref:Effector-binding domain-containing protein n=1 Tax=Zeaxanthinibacter enoshimensis TaxID=392009 RepID=A0A4R6TQ11_9FLAO|nr:GyrI-like domain-containing protein [Zeaxanthinibacter enoshimensis]TDQ33250.1 effector-binding domain-containing protein [Zeaxanthinibacter enoshimensis]
MKRLGLLFLLVVILALCWYLFMKPFDYLVRFETRGNAGTINQTLKTWNTTQENAAITAQQDLYEIVQQLPAGDTQHEYHWKITPESDTTSLVQVYVTGADSSFKDRAAILFSDTQFEKETRKRVTDFARYLNDHLDKFRVRITGITELPATFSACTQLETSQIGKAFGMMKNYPLLSEVMAADSVPLNGRPYVELQQWNRKKDSISFKFCYPIMQTDSLPLHQEIHYTERPGIRAIKAVYNGNYLTSDRAWYALLNYAKKNGLETTGLPIEVFFNNPNMGGNELEWTAEIYLPLKSEND